MQEMEERRKVGTALHAACPSSEISRQRLRGQLPRSGSRRTGAGSALTRSRFAVRKNPFARYQAPTYHFSAPLSGPFGFFSGLRRDLSESAGLDYPKLWALG